LDGTAVNKGLLQSVKTGGLLPAQLGLLTQRFDGLYGVALHLHRQKHAAIYRFAVH
jgi:hypothetical protein